MGVDVHGAQPIARPGRRFAVLEKGDDPAQLHAAIVHPHPGVLRELFPQPGGERLDPRFDRVHAHPRRVAGRDAQADLAGHESLPVLESARVVTDDVGVGVGPRGGVEIDERGLEPLDGVTAHVEEAGAAGPAQILAAGGREHVAADLPHIDRELADRLAGVEQIEEVVARGDAADLRRGIDEPASPGHVGDRDQLRAGTDRALERGEVDLAGRVALDHVDLDPRARLDLQEREVVRQVLGARGDDAVARPEGDRVEGHVPGARGVLHDRDLVRPGPDQGGHGVVGILDAIGCFGRRLVAADGSFAL